MVAALGMCCGWTRRSLEADDHEVLAAAAVAGTVVGDAAELSVESLDSDEQCRLDTLHHRHHHHLLIPPSTPSLDARACSDSDAGFALNVDFDLGSMLGTHKTRQRLESIQQTGSTKSPTMLRRRMML